MSSFANLQFPSDDSEDSDYHDSGESDYDENSKECQNQKEDTETQGLKHAKQKQALKLLNSMATEALEALSHHSKVSNLDSLLPYHKPQPLEQPKKCSSLELDDYLNRALGIKVPPTPVDAKLLKQAVRKEANFLPLSGKDVVQPATKDLPQDAVINVTRKVKYAGQEYDIEEALHRESTAYKKQTVDIGKRRLGGALRGLDDAFCHLKSLQGITSVEKSRADWHTYKKSQNISLEALKGAEGSYLSRQAFLAGVDIAQYEISLEARRKRRLLMQNQTK